VELFDQHGVDLLQTLGLNRDFAAREEVNLIYASTSNHPVVKETDTLTLRVSNNTVVAAVITIELTYALGA